MEKESVIKNTCALIEAAGADYTLHHHEACATMEDCLRLPFLADCTYCKNLALVTRNRSDRFLLLTKASLPFRTADCSKQLGVSRLSFCPAEELFDFLQVHPGSVNPFALAFDKEGIFELVVEESLKHCEKIAFHPNTNEATVIMSFDGFLLVMDHIKKTPVYISLA